MRLKLFTHYYSACVLQILSLKSKTIEIGQILALWPVFEISPYQRIPCPKLQCSCLACYSPHIATTSSTIQQSTRLVAMSLSSVSQKVIQFEYSRMQTPHSHPKQHPGLQAGQSHRYQSWQLAGKLRQLGVGEQQCRVSWCGYGNQYFVEAFVYCLLADWRKTRAIESSSFTLMKYSLYQLAEKHLVEREQRELVENLCYAQYTNDLIAFLNNNQVLEFLIFKMFKSVVYAADHVLLPIEEIKLFAANFSHVQFHLKGDSVGYLKTDTSQFYILSEKECVFVVELPEEGQRAANRREQDQETITAANQNSPEAKLHSNKHDSANNEAKSTPKFVLQSTANKKSHKKQHINLSSYLQIRNPESLISKFDLSENTRLGLKMNSNPHSSKSHKKVSVRHRKSPIESLRNTLDTHIARLRSLEKPKQRKSRPEHLVGSIEANPQSATTVRTNCHPQMQSPHSHSNHLLSWDHSHRNLTHRHPANSHMVIPQYLSISRQSLSPQQKRVSFTYVRKK